MDAAKQYLMLPNVNLQAYFELSLRLPVKTSVFLKIIDKKRNSAFYHGETAYCFIKKRENKKREQKKPSVRMVCG